MEHYDLIVIGSGPSGEKAAVKAAFYGKKVAIIEKSNRYGGAGSQTGTLPSKTLKETAIYLSGVREEGVYGVERKLEHSAQIDDFFYRKDYVADVTSQEISKNLQGHGVTIFKGEGAFKDEKTIIVTSEDGTKVITSDFILVATGSYPFHPTGIPFDGVHVHDSDTILSLNRFPKSLVIVGAGVIGCEYATIFSVMGCKVTLVNGRPDFLTFVDSEMVKHLREYMEERGVTFILNDRCEDVVIKEEDGEAIVHAHLEDGTPIEAEMFLYAAGRSGRIASLNLEAAGVETGPRETIKVDSCYRTNVPHIFAVGDVVGFPALASTGMDQGRVAVAHMFGLNDLKAIDQQFPYGIYTIPEISSVGLSEDECISKGIPYGVGRANVSDMPRGRIMGFTKGMLKLIYNKVTHETLGVHIIASQATELIHFGMLLVEERIRLNRIISMVYNFPTLHELYKYAAYDAFSAEMEGQSPSAKTPSES